MASVAVSAWMTLMAPARPATASKRWPARAPREGSVHAHVYRSSSWVCVSARQ